MAEEIHSDSFPDLNELENKIGRKTPDSLLAWMREECAQGWRSVHPAKGSDPTFCHDLTDKITNLRQELRWLRSTDVKILKQLVAVHEGIEAMRWLMEERGTSTSRCSSLTGSLSSLATVEEHGLSMSPCRDSFRDSATFPEDLFKTWSEKPAHTKSVDPDHSELTTKDIRPPSPPTPRSTVIHSASGRPDQSSATAAGQPKKTKGNAETIRRALQRSIRTRKELKADLFGPSQQLEAKINPIAETFTAAQNDTKDHEETPAVVENVLPGYDAQWCWVESQDDVTFL
ncbi:leucine rich adaptor protein 1 isoform X1 [Oryzias melastigma]|uniref:Leucine rich adaptor protein 1-like n=1 Tax=Oryzias melastigma TaxID=30732 RepID=A0A3B3BPG5_ORYME|nr:leucine rich adaptor protein 1 isoform X1 [Oryzias melastigma]